MGKSKNKKFRASKPKPTGLPSVKEVEDEEAAGVDTSMTLSARNISVHNAVEKLQSANEEAREWGCLTIADMVGQPGAIATLLQQNVVKILAPLIVDHSLQVRHQAVGALRNMSVDGGSEVCEEMVKKDVLTPLVTLYQQYGSGWLPNSSEGKKQASLRIEIFTEATHLLWNLCESSEVAISVFNKENLIGYLWPCLQSDVYGYPLATTVAQCLYTVTEDNPTISAICRTTEMLPVVESLMAGPADTSHQALLRTLASGILVNVFSGQQQTSAPAATMSAIVKSVSDILDLDVFGMLQRIVGEQNGIGTGDHMEATQAKVDEQSNKSSEKLAEVDNVLAAQQVALEITANVCCSDDDWEDIASNESSSSDDLSADMEVDETEDSDLISPFCVPTEIHSAILSNNIISKVLVKAKPPSDELLQHLDTLPQKNHLKKKLQRLQTHALLCVNNLLNAVEPDGVGGRDNLQQVWQGLTQLASSKQTIDNMELLEAVTSAMRAVIQKLAQLESKQFSQISPNDLQFVFEMGQHCPHREVRVNAVRISSTIGCVLAHNPDSHPLLKDIGRFLLEISLKDSELWVVAEALDSIFDVFGEDSVDGLVKEMCLVEKLQQLLPVLKAKINHSRRSLEEHYPVISTAKTNLIRFIKYKTAS